MRSERGKGMRGRGAREKRLLSPQVLVTILDIFAQLYYGAKSSILCIRPDSLRVFYMTLFPSQYRILSIAKCE